MFKKLALTFALSCGLLASSDAATLVLYSFTPSGDLTSSDADALTTASSLSNGAGMTPTYTTVATVPTSQTTNNTIPGNNDYFEFTLTPTASVTINLNSFSFGATSASTSGTGAALFALRSSVDNFAAVIPSIANVQSTTLVNRSVDLSAPAFQGLTSSITFRLYIGDGGANTNNATVDNITLDGVSSIPEPSTYALLAGGLALLVVLRRKRSL